MLVLAHIEKSHHAWELRERLAHARDAGFDGVEIALDAGAKGECRACDWMEPEESCRAIAAEAQRCGVPIRAAVLADEPAARIADPDAARQAEAVERVRSAAWCCERLGSGVLRLIPAALRTGSPRAVLSYQDALNSTCRRLESLRLDCERRGVVAAVIPCHHGFLLSPPEFRELLDRISSPFVGAALDWTACAKIGDPVDWIHTLQHRLAAVSVDLTAREPTPLEEAWADTLRENGFDGVIIHTGGTWTAGALERFRHAPPGVDR